MPNSLNAILKAIRMLMENKDELLASTKECLQAALDAGNDGIVNTSALEEQIRTLQAEMVGLVDKCVKTSSGADAYDEQFKALADKIKALQAKLDAVGSQGSDADNSRLSEILSAIESKDFDLSHYDDSLARLLVENITVTSEQTLKVRLKDIGAIEATL